jgi:hypothetical protein
MKRPCGILAISLIGAISVHANAQIAVIHETAKLGRSGSAAISSISVGIDGDTAMVGDLLDDDRGRDAGAVYVFERDAAGTWLEVDKLTASDAQPCRRFGRSIAVKGDTLIVGHSTTLSGFIRPDCDPSNIGGSGRGGMYVFDKNSGGWLESTRFTSSSSFFFPFPVGADLAFDGRRFLTGWQVVALLFGRNDDGSWSAPISLRPAGAPGPDDEDVSPDLGIFGNTAILGNSVPLSGGPSGIVGTSHADIFELDTVGNWNVVADLRPPGAIRSVFLDAQVSVAEGIASVDEFVYRRDTAGVWVPDGTFAPAGLPAGSRIKARLEGAGTAVVSAGVETSASLHVFLRSEDGPWIETARLVPSGGDSLGAEFAIDSRRVITTGTTLIFDYALFSSVDRYLGNRANWTELTPTRWSLSYDTDVRYSIRSTDYSNLSGSRLGEYALVNDRTYGDFHVSAEAKSTDDFAVNEAADYDVVFGYQDANNYYYMMFNHAVDLTELFKVVDGQRQTIASYAGRAFVDNDYHTIEVVRTGTQIQVSIGGTQILSANDATFGAGLIGLGSFNDSVRFDDVTITAPGSGPGPVVIEAEGMHLSNGYSVEGGSRIVLPDDVQGYATQTFDGASGVYDIEVQLISGDTGLSVVEVYRNSERLGYLYYDFSAAQHTLSIPGVSVSQGDFILLAGFSENGGGARVDSIVFTRR